MGYCKVCGGELAPDDRYGVCVNTPECCRVVDHFERQEDNEQVRRYHKTLHGKAERLCNSARHRAKVADIPFDLDVEWVERELQYAIDHGCPYLGTPIAMDAGRGDPDSPSIDKIDPKGGYIKDNCIIVSRRANTIKNDATVDELKLIASNLEKITISRSAGLLAA